MEITSAPRQTARSHGGQASLGLFGILSFDASQRQLSRCSPAPVDQHRTSVAPARRLSLDDDRQLAHSRWLADLADAHGCSFDEDAAAYARSFAGVGYAEHLMALEGSSTRASPYKPSWSTT